MSEIDPQTAVLPERVARQSGPAKFEMVRQVLDTLREKRTALSRAARD